MINPTKQQEKTYKLLLELQTEAINALKPGAKLSAVMSAVVNRVKSKAPHLEKHLTKNCGFATVQIRSSACCCNIDLTAHIAQ